MENAQGKVALITGASSGIGEFTAKALAAEGFRVAVAARRADRLQTVADEITSSGGQVFCMTVDVTDEAQVQQMVKQTHDHWGQIDVLVNNAGLMLLGPIADADTEDWRRMIQTNLLGLMYATHAVLPIMKAQGSGHIVNVSSLAGRIARVGSGVYNATKWGVGAFSESLRQECFRDHIRVTIIEPGVVDTDLATHITNAQARENSLKRKQSMTPLQSEDIARAIVYAVTQPPHVNVNEILIRPTEQEN